jgi:diacylglycerol kinase family enzyme
MPVPIEPVLLHFEPEDRQASTDLEPYNHIFMMAHPGDRYRKAKEYHHQRLLVRGNEHGFKVDEEPIGTAETIVGNKKILETLGKTSLIAVVGGDGTASMLMRAAYELGIDNPFMILDGGNAINQGRMHNRGRHLDRAEQILRNGWVRQVYPTLDRAEYPDGTVVDTMAFAYTTRGFTARATAGLTAAEHRDKVEDAPGIMKVFEEAKVTLEATKRIAPFIVREPDRPDRTRMELAYVSGRLMAKYIRFPSDIFEKENVIVEAEDVRYRTVGKAALSLALPFARRRHDWLKEGQEHRLQLISQDGSSIDVEYDGEARQDPSGTTYTLRISDKGVNVVTTRRP